jgi:hypothetical protein
MVPGQMPKILPTAKFAPMIEEPSRGSNATFDGITIDNRSGIAS